MDGHVDYCTKCGRKIKEETLVILELCSEDGEYYFVNPWNRMPEEISQGGFTFGKDCAESVGKRWIKNADWDGITKHLLETHKELWEKLAGM